MESVTTPTTPPKVLVVEDDESLRGALERLRGLAGFSAAAYPSAESLLQAGLGETAACVVCDLRLPAMSGLDLLAELQAHGFRSPLILITARQRRRPREGPRRGEGARLDGGGREGRLETRVPVREGVIP